MSDLVLAGLSLLGLLVWTSGSVATWKRLDTRMLNGWDVATVVVSVAVTYGALLSMLIHGALATHHHSWDWVWTAPAWLWGFFGAIVGAVAIASTATTPDAYGILPLTVLWPVALVVRPLLRLTVWLAVTGSKAPLVIGTKLVRAPRVSASPERIAAKERELGIGGHDG